MSISASSSYVEYKKLIEFLPLETIVYAFAYGSGVFKQKNENIGDKMVDFILVSNDAPNFHRENLKRNGSHYSWSCKLIGRRKEWSGIYYNTLIWNRGRLIKYGIISIKDFHDDLLDWCSLYVAGRLHKPVHDLISPPISTDSEFYSIRNALIENRRSALDASLLQMPDKFSLRELLVKIVSLSYHGDVRYFIGEHDKKIHKIVAGSYDELSEIYHSFLARDPRVSITSEGRIEQDIGTPAIYYRLNLLPFSVQHMLQRSFRRSDKRYFDVEEDLFALAHKHDISRRVGEAIFQIVRSSSIKQTIKNATTAGFFKSFIYLFRKLKSSGVLKFR